MLRALALARRGIPTASPNPLVGAVIVRGDRIVGEGYHLRPGEPHAEVGALQRAGRRAKGATLYVTLEPCSSAGRTPPCTDAILESGVRSVVIGAEDPHPAARGRGIGVLKRKVRVVSDVLGQECRRLNEGYNMRILRRRPFVILKLAASLDGKIATSTGDSKWITGTAARRWVHRLRASVDAILVGHGTVERDDPRLTPREVPTPTAPLRVVVDTALRLDPRYKIFNIGAPGSTLLATSVTNPQRHRPFMERGVLVITFPRRGVLLDLRALLGHLADLGVNRLLVEGGSAVAGTAVDLDVVDRVHLFYAPIMIGGHRAIPMVGGQGAKLISHARKLGPLEFQRIGDDVLVTADRLR